MRINVDPRMKKLLGDIVSVAQGLGRSWGVTLSLPDTARQPYKTLRPRKHAAPKQPTNAEVLGFLIKLKGDFLRNTPQLQAKLKRELTVRFVNRGTFPNVQALMMAAAIIYRDWMVDRLYNSGKDVSVPGNTTRWTDRKRALGYSTKVLMASGQLARAINKSIPRIVRQ